MEPKLESRLNIRDLKSLQTAFMTDGCGYDNKLSLNREQFCRAMALILKKGSKDEYMELFNKIDVTGEGMVDWDMFASHMLLEFYEKDDRVKSTQVPQWKNLRFLPSPHKEVIQKIMYLKNSNRYVAISKEGCVSMWSPNLRLQRTIKTATDACRTRDLWVTSFVPLNNVNKIALSFTSKEIAIYDLSSKLEFNCQYKVQGLEYTPLCLDYWFNHGNPNEAIMTWGDTGGCVNVIHFNSANIALFERPSAPAGEKQEPCLNVQLKDVMIKKYKNARFSKHQGHSDWVRLVIFSPHLECFISCATTWNNSLVIGWLEKQTNTNRNMKTRQTSPDEQVKAVLRTTTFQITQGVNAFDYYENLNIIATAGVNHHVCLWNPYVVSKPTGVLRGHMASVVQVQFNKPRGQLISFSKDKVLRIWDVQLQVCMQRLAGMFPKGPEVLTRLYFDDRCNRLFVTFKSQMTILEMKPEIRDRIMSHDKPVVGAMYNSTYNQVVSACQDGTVVIWMIDSGQKVKTVSKTHDDAEVSCLAQDPSETRFYTGSTDGTVKIWDFNGHCHHKLICGLNDQPVDVGQILVLKRSVLVVGWAKYITVFRNQLFRDYIVEPSDWKGGQGHSDDILALAFCGPNSLASGSYDGEIVIWNNSSEQASKHIRDRCRKTRIGGATFVTTRENTVASTGGFDSHSYLPERPKTRPKSRTASRVSLGCNDDSNEYGFAISKLLYLEARKTQCGPAAANLVSCGGNGWVRFWNTTDNLLMAEYVAHTQVGSVIMTIDPDNHWLVTGDVDGFIKVWDISEYCLLPTDAVIKEAPPLKCQFHPHLDMIISLQICIRNERPLILSSSSDCSVALWDVYGNHIGVFGQEEHWKIEPYIPKSEADEDYLVTSKIEKEPIEIQQNQDEENGSEIESEGDSQWEPDEQATTDPGQYRVNTWGKSCLGKEYQELRVQKRERKQPGVISDLPYLHWEKTGQAPAGPYAALDITSLSDVTMLQEPDFIQNPNKYFSQRPTSGEPKHRQPALSESLKAAFDEKALFPKYILEYEAKMKSQHAQSLLEAQKKAGQGLLKSVFGGSSTEASKSNNSLNRKQAPVKPHRLKPMPVRGKDPGE